MKKFLSMVLALVMVMSLATVSAGAKDFTDNDSITYDEAVAVISEIGVVDGDTNGSFRPTDTLTRQAAAKIICNLILGPTTAAELHADTAPYKDVAVNNQFAGYIAYCQSRGIISGYADGSFRPTGTLTGYAFMKMLLGALGYDASLEGYVGSNWSINVAKQALGIQLNKGLEGEFNGIKAVTREEACLYAFRTLQADLVEYGQRLTTSINGTEVTLSSGGAHAKEWDSQQTRKINILDDNIIQFAEEYFNKLEKKPDTDEFERPGYTWLWDKAEIGTYVDWDLLVEEYTAEVTGRELYDLLGATTLRESDMTYFVDGLVPDDYTTAAYNFPVKDINAYGKDDIARSNTKDFGVSAKGVLTQVFLKKGIGRNDRNELTITSIDTWLAKATGDYQENKEYAPFDVYHGWNSSTSTTIKSGWNVDVEDVPAVVDVKDEDYRLVNISFKDNVKGDVVEIAEPEVFEQSTVTKFSKSNSKVVDKLTTSGTEYKSARMAFFSDDALEEYNQSLLPDHTYNVFMDPYGYVIAVELDDGAKNYVFITGFDRPTSNLSISTANAAGIFLDGTMDTFRVNVTETNKNIDRIKATETGREYFVKWTNENFPGDEGSYRLNRWFSYSTNQSGVYTLTPATRMTATKYDNTDATNGKVTVKTANVSLQDNVLRSTNFPYSPTAGMMGTWSKVNNAPFNVRYTDNNNVRAYGNDDSVYITVDLDDVDTDDGTRAITDVNEVFTGVQEVELEIDVNSNIEEAQIYTVYDRNGYIIGAVTTGEVKGGNSTVAYVLSGVKSERYESAEDAHYWEFDAFVNGEKQTLTVKDKYGTLKGAVDTEYRGSARTHLAGIGTNGTTNYNLYDGIVELRFDADNNVVDIRNVLEKDIYSHYGDNNGDFGGNSVTPQPAVADRLKLDDAKAYRMNVLNKTYVRGNTWAFGGTNHRVDSTPSTLMLQGRTLYVTEDRSDEGLALITDAKALTIQKENGSWEETPYTSVASAISGLADANPDKDGFQFEGEVVAAVNGNGAATWVVFINYTELLTGNKGNQTGGNKDEGKYFDATSYIYENGFAALRVDVTRPAWLDDAKALDYTYDVYVNDAPYATVNSASSTDVGANALTATDTWDNSTGNMFLFRPITAGDKITVKNFKFDLTDHVYFVEYVDQSGNVLYRGSNVTANKIDTKILSAATDTVTSASGGTSLDFTISNAKYTTATAGTYGIVGLETDVAAGTATEAPGTSTTNASAEAKDKLEDYVRVTINLNGLTPNTKVDVTNKTAQKLNAVTGAPSGLADALTVTVTTNRPTEPGGTVNVICTPAGTIAATENYGLKVTMSNDVVIVWKNDGSAPSAVTTPTVLTADTEITITRVEKIDAPTIRSATIVDTDASGTFSSGDVITINFDRAVASGTVTPAGDVTATGGVKVDADKMFATITLTANPTAATDKLTISALTADGDGVKNTGTWEIVTTNAADSLTSSNLTVKYVPAP